MMSLRHGAPSNAWAGEVFVGPPDRLRFPTPMLPGLRTKVEQPRVPPDHVVRERLIRLLDRGLQRRVTLVSAPGGFGKTTLLSTWNPPGYLVSWLTVDEG